MSTLFAAVVSKLIPPVVVVIGYTLKAPVFGSATFSLGMQLEYGKFPVFGVVTETPVLGMPNLGFLLGGTGITFGIQSGTFNSINGSVTLTGQVGFANGVGFTSGLGQFAITLGPTAGVGLSTTTNTAASFSDIAASLTTALSNIFGGFFSLPISPTSSDTPNTPLPDVP